MPTITGRRSFTETGQRSESVVAIPGHPLGRGGPGRPTRSETFAGFQSVRVTRPYDVYHLNAIALLKVQRSLIADWWWLYAAIGVVVSKIVDRPQPPGRSGLVAGSSMMPIVDRPSYQGTGINMRQPVVHLGACLHTAAVPMHARCTEEAA